MEDLDKQSAASQMDPVHLAKLEKQVQQFEKGVCVCVWGGGGGGVQCYIIYIILFDGHLVKHAANSFKSRVHCNKL